MTPTATPATPHGLNLSAHVNASGYILDDDPEEFNYTNYTHWMSELQTVVIACLATILPLGFAMVLAFFIRIMWKRLWGEDYEEESLRRANSSDPNKSSHLLLPDEDSVEAPVGRGLRGRVTKRANSSDPNKSSHLLLPDEIKTSESQFSVIPAEELEEVMTSYSSSAPSSANLNHTSKSTANGSVITMTMKNNHLIVETEERILAVNEPPCEPSPPTDQPGDEDRTALVHQSEEDGPNTGMSQSDLSVSSSGSANPSYCYGNQVEYLGDERDLLPQVHSTTAVWLKHAPFTVQPSQDIEDDDLYLEQQHQLGNGLDDLQTVPECCNPYENAGFVATPEQPQVNPTS